MVGRRMGRTVHSLVQTERRWSYVDCPAAEEASGEDSQSNASCLADTAGMEGVQVKSERESVTAWLYPLHGNILGHCVPPFL